MKKKELAAEVAALRAEVAALRMELARKWTPVVVPQPYYPHQPYVVTFGGQMVTADTKTAITFNGAPDAASTAREVVKAMSRRHQMEAS